MKRKTGEGKSTTRSGLVIDEAHNYHGQKNIFLQRIIHEGSSKGVIDAKYGKRALS